MLFHFLSDLQINWEVRLKPCDIGKRREKGRKGEMSENKMGKSAQSPSRSLKYTSWDIDAEQGADIWAKKVWGGWKSSVGMEIDSRDWKERKKNSSGKCKIPFEDCRM